MMIDGLSLGMYHRELRADTRDLGFRGCYAEVAIFGSK